MGREREKIERLVRVCRMYYEQDLKQSEIAETFGISRPLVSRMLKEARERGIVHIEIQSPEDVGEGLLEQACHRFGLKGGALVPNASGDVETNERIVRQALGYLAELGQENIGIGWGHIIGAMVEEMEQSGPYEGLACRVFPLMGNSEVSNRNYHSNELVRIFAAQAKAKPEYLYAPAFVTTGQELGQFRRLENYRAIEAAWKQMDVAVVNIGNYPSTPDFASEARYGGMLRQQHAVGRILNYFFDLDGNIFHSEIDYAVRVPLKILKKTRHVIGVCSANINSRAVLGALRTGCLHHLIGPRDQVRGALEEDAGPGQSKEI